MRRNVMKDESICMYKTDHSYIGNLDIINQVLRPSLGSRYTRKHARPSWNGGEARTDEGRL